MTDQREAQATKSFLHDLRFELFPTEHGMTGTFEVTPEMIVPGSEQVHVGILATVADVAMGTPVSNVEGKSVVGLTIDLVTRVLGPIGPGTYDVDATVLKRGRTIAVADTTFARSGAVVGHCVATFMPMPKKGARLGAGVLDAPFADSLGIVVDQPGVASVERRPYTLQPAGTIQGGVVCTLAEVAAASILGGPIADLDVRFLAQVKVGPGRAVAERLDAATARIIVTDAGTPDPRPTAYAIARRA